MPIPSTYTYTVEEYKTLIDEWIENTKELVGEDGKAYRKVLPNPATLRIHLNLSKQTISGYKNEEEHEAYKADTLRAYNHMEAYGWTDLDSGNGKAGNFMLGRVMKYSEKSVVEHEGQQIKVVMPSVTVGDKPLSFNVGEDV